MLALALALSLSHSLFLLPPSLLPFLEIEFHVTKDSLAMWEYRHAQHIQLTRCRELT